MKKKKITLLVLAHRRDIINKTKGIICEDSQNDVKKTHQFQGFQT